MFFGCAFVKHSAFEVNYAEISIAGRIVMLIVFVVCGASGGAGIVSVLYFTRAVISHIANTQELEYFDDAKNMGVSEHGGSFAGEW